MSLKLYFVIACGAILSVVCNQSEAENSSVETKGISISQACSPPGPNPDFIQFQNSMEEHFKRNLPPGLCLPNDVTIRFYVTPDGLVRNVFVVKSCGNKNIDLACVEAAYFGSPLPSPPKITQPLPPPPSGYFLGPEFFGSRTYTYTFSKTPAKKSSREISYFEIPIEVKFRYPGLFSSGELAPPDNTLALSTKTATPEMFEACQLQWEFFYKNNPKPSKQAIQDWSREITKRFVEKRPGI
jgi:TonB family protein